MIVQKTWCVCPAHLSSYLKSAFYTFQMAKYQFNVIFSRICKRKAKFFDSYEPTNSRLSKKKFRLKPPRDLNLSEWTMSRHVVLESFPIAGEVFYSTDKLAMFSNSNLCLKIYWCVCVWNKLLKIPKNLVIIGHSSS